jgi:hypothetical protein
MKHTYKTIAGVAAVLSLALAATVYAHPGGGMGPGWGPAMGMGAGMGPGMGAVDMRAAAAARTAQLKSELKITTAQEAAWKAYESAVTKQAAAMQSFRAQMQNAQPGTSAPDRAAQREAMFRQHEAGLQAHTAALKDLYAALTPEQRAIADRDMGPMGGYRMGGWQRMR